MVGTEPVRIVTQVADAAKSVAQLLRDQAGIYEENGIQSLIPDYVGMATAFQQFADVLNGEAVSHNDSRLAHIVYPTADMLTIAADTLSDLMSGRGVDTRDGFDWSNFIVAMRDRAKELS